MTAPDLSVLPISTTQLFYAEALITDIGRFTVQIENNARNLVIDQKRKLVRIAIEAAQNVVKHAQKGTSGRSLIDLSRTPTGYRISTQNVISNDSIDNLRETFGVVNSLHGEDLKNAYIHQLQQPTAGTNCGLGIMLMKRLAGLPLEINFEPIDKLYSYFYLHVRFNGLLKSHQCS